MRISDWSSDVCSSDLRLGARLRLFGGRGAGRIARDIVLQLGALDVLIGLCRRQLRHPLGALALERIVPAGIKRQLAALQMQDVIDDIVQEIRSEEHTSELQSLMRISYAVFCLKKKNHIKYIITVKTIMHRSLI